GGEGELLGEGRQVVLAVEYLQMGKEAGTLADEEVATAEQVAGLAHALGVDVGQGEVASPEETSDLVGGDLVVLGLGPVDGLHVQGVTDQEGDLLLGAQIRQPVPAERRPSWLVIWASFRLAVCPSQVGWPAGPRPTAATTHTRGAGLFFDLD